MFVGDGAQAVDLVTDGAELPTVHQLGGVVVDQVGGCGEFAGGDGVLDCRVGVAFVPVPGRGSAVNAGEVGCSFGFEPE